MAQLLNKKNIASGGSSPEYDYRSPFMRATIIRPNGDRFPLWTDLGLTPQQKESIGLTINSLAYLQELSIEIQAAYLPIMKARLVFPYKEGIAFLNSKLIEWGYSTLEVIFGYTGGAPGGKVLSPVYQGTLLQPDIDIGTQVTVTLNAQGVGAFAAANTTRTGGPYTKTRKELIDFFAKGPDPKTARNLIVDDKLIIKGSAEDKAYNETEKDFAPSGKTDWACIFELVQASSCWLVQVGNTIKLYPKATAAHNIDRVFRHFDYPAGNISSSTSTYPIMSLSSQAPAIYLPSEAIGYWSTDIPSSGADAGNSKKLIEHVVNHENYAIDTTGKGNTGPAKTKNTAVADYDSKTGTGTKDGLGFFVGSPEVPKWVNQMEQNLRSAMQYVGMQITINTLGIPDLKPMENIAIRGYGERMDGENFSILKINHTLGTGGFTTSFDAFKNVQSPFIAEDQKPPTTKTSLGTTGKNIFPDRSPGDLVRAKFAKKGIRPIR